VKWHFNGWAKYRNWRADHDAGVEVAAFSESVLVLPDFAERRVVLEGGSIDVNGSGSLLTTEECLLSVVQQRNPGLERGQIEALFEGWLGASNVIWLNCGIAGDDTHGHIDDIARFVSPNTVLAAIEDNLADPNHVPLEENYAILRDAVDERGAKLRVVPLPMPSRSTTTSSACRRRMRTSTSPQDRSRTHVHDSNDRVALNILAKLFPTGRSSACMPSILCSVSARCTA